MLEIHEDINVEIQVIDRDAGEVGGEKFKPGFNDPSANIVLKSSDGWLFRVHDFYLKVNR